MTTVDTKTDLNIQLSKDNTVIKRAIVREGYNNKYILVELEDHGIDHTFELKWDGYMFRGKFLDFDMTCQYKVITDFSSTKNPGQKSETFTRKKSGYPKK